MTEGVWGHALVCVGWLCLDEVMESDERGCCG